LIQISAGRPLPRPGKDAGTGRGVEKPGYGRYGIYMAQSLSGPRVQENRSRNPSLPLDGPSVQSLELCSRSRVMLDIAYLVIGAVFLGACVLYALACDHL
jgi:hypothetical protein